MLAPWDGRTVDGYRITTTFRRIDDKLEELDQETIPDHNFPWKDIFVCGYGAGRGTSGTGDIAGYTAISAVYNLFNYSEGLQNPELTIRRLEQDSARGTQILQSAEEILELRNLRLAGFAHSDSGINAIDPRGVSIALRDLADGYKSTFLWVTDFLGWAFANQNGEGKNLKGIVVIDELEQHLHPKWQRRIIPVLRRIWPHVQFFAATHSPLIARSFRSGAGNGPETDLHAHLHLRTSDNGKTVDCIAIPSLGGHRTDQILASEAFDYLIDDDPEAEALLSEYALLLGSEALTAAEQQRAQDIATGLQHIQAIRTGQTPYERSAAEWAEMTRAFVVERLNNTEGEAERDSD